MLVNQIRIYFDHFLPNRCRSSDGEPTCLLAYKKRQDDGNSRHPAAERDGLLRSAWELWATRLSSFTTSTMVRFVLFICYIKLWCALSSSSATSTMVRFVLFVRYINYGALCPLHLLWSFTLHSFGIGPRCTYFRNSALFLVLSDSGAAIHSNIVQI